MSKKILKFHKDFYNPIFEGFKSSTIRIKDKDLEIGDIVTLKFDGTDKIIILNINNIYMKKFKNLSYTEARTEGYMHPDLLKHELKQIYPKLTDDDLVYIYCFEVEKE